MKVAGRFDGTSEKVWDGSSLNTERGGRDDNQAPNSEDYDRAVGELIATQEVLVEQESRLAVLETAAESEAGVADNDVEVDESAGYVHRTVIALSEFSIAMADADSNGSHGSQKLYDFPAGNILILGAVTDLTVERGGTDLAADAAVVGSVGTATVGTDNATLTTTEADIVPSTAATLADGVGAMAGVSTTSEVAAHDGTSSPVSAYLNFAVPDADSTDDDSLTVSGTVTITWVNLGG